jgi:RNA polymerase sigma-70 factor (ECF subfamily)
MTSKPSFERLAAPVIPIRRPESDEALVAALKEGGPGAGHALFAAYGGYVRRVLMRVMGPDPDLGDLTQDVFVAALQSIHKLERAGALRGWLAQIAVFQARHCLRGRKQWSILRFFAPESLPPGRAREVDFEASEALRATYRVLASLPVDERIAFTLRFVEGMSLADVAATARVSLATAKRRLARAETRFAELARSEPSLSEWIGGDHEPA